MDVPQTKIEANGYEYNVQVFAGDVTQHQISMLLQGLRLSWILRNPRSHDAAPGEDGPQINGPITVQVHNTHVRFVPGQRQLLSVRWPTDDERARKAYGHITGVEASPERTTTVVRGMLAELGIHGWGNEPHRELSLQFVSNA